MKQFKAAHLHWITSFLGIIGLIWFYLSTTTKDFNETRKSFDELGGDFTLQSYAGPVSLSDYKGQVVVMYFGYLSCAEVCPNSLAVMTNAFMRLEKQGFDQVQGLLVTVDPARDTVEDLKEYTDYFHERITGLTGSAAQTKEVGGLYGVYYDDENLEESFMEYSVAHASRFYIINKEGDLITAMSHTTTPNELAAQIKELML